MFQHRFLFINTHCKHGTGFFASGTVLQRASYSLEKRRFESSLGCCVTAMLKFSQPHARIWRVYEEEAVIIKWPNLWGCFATRNSRQRFPPPNLRRDAFRLERRQRILLLRRIPHVTGIAEDSDNSWNVQIYFWSHLGQEQLLHSLQTVGTPTPIVLSQHSQQQETFSSKDAKLGSWYLRRDYLFFFLLFCNLN